MTPDMTFCHRFHENGTGAAFRLIFLSGETTALMFVSRLVWQAFRHSDRFLVHKSSFKSLFYNKSERLRLGFPRSVTKAVYSSEYLKPTRRWSWNVHQQASPMGDDHKIPVTCHYTSYLLFHADVSRPDGDGNKLDKHIIVLNNSSKTIFHLYGPDFLHEPHSLLLRRATKISAMNKFDEKGRNLNARVLSRLSMLSHKRLPRFLEEPPPGCRRSRYWHGSGH